MKELTCSVTLATTYENLVNLVIFLFASRSAFMVPLADARDGPQDESRRAFVRKSNS